MLGRKQRNGRAAGAPVGSVTRTGWALLAVLVLAAAFAPAAVLAQSAADQVAAGLESAQSIGLGTADVRVMVARIVNAAFGLMGIITVTLFVYAGYLWMTSQGDSGKIDTARRIMVNTVIGAVIILLSYSIAQFVIRAIFGDDGYGRGPTYSESYIAPSYYCDGCGPEQLGNGIISYHYPEPNQTDVPRNTGIAITFKLPLLPSTVLRNYFDNGTYATDDDEWCPDACAPGEARQPITADSAFYLNDDNVKVIAFADLQPYSSGGTDEAAFASRYDSPELLAGLPASLTQVAAEFDPYSLGQTLIITPPLDRALGSSQAPVSYRVGLKGGTEGIRVFAWDANAGAPAVKNAFDRLNPDGSYFWNFTTGTLMDLVPPTIRSVVPATRQELPADGSPTGRLYRNQLLQAYFSKRMNPATVSGTNGSGGFNALEVRYLDGNGTWQVLDGQWVVASGYRAVEFVPSAPCDGIAENSCGDKVYCLPANVRIAVAARPASVSDQPPRAASLNGIADMVSNVLDGNADGRLAGPGAVGWGSALSGNPLLIAGTSVRANFFEDTAVWVYEVGNDIDLEPPKVTAVVPSNLSSALGQPYPSGSSGFPPGDPITSDWTKVISIRSIVTGPDSYVPATVGLRAREVAKSGQPVGPPGFSVEPVLIDDGARSRLVMSHRRFMTANDLGWTVLDSGPESIPLYVPVFKSRLTDDRQNCFFPSEAVNCSGIDRNSPYCCNDQTGGAQLPACRP